jgi:peptidoglycan/LPS O-acetylase OafA/YrhL
VRAVAIGAVLAFHAGIVALPGGFLGVDVFFVLSGYLITSLLLGEAALSKTIDLGDFYARRFRRLFPGLAAMVGATVALATFVAADAVATTWQDLPAATFGWMN